MIALKLATPPKGKEKLEAEYIASVQRLSGVIQRVVDECKKEEKRHS